MELNFSGYGQPADNAGLQRLAAGDFGEVIEFTNRLVADQERRERECIEGAVEWARDLGEPVTYHPPHLVIVGAPDVVIVALPDGTLEEWERPYIGEPDQKVSTVTTCAPVVEPGPRPR